MMKKSSLILMIIGTVLSVAGAVCLVIGFWDKLVTAFDVVKAKAIRPKEYDAFADVE